MLNQIMQQIDKSVTATSMIRPIYEYLDKQKDNEKFLHSLEIGATFILISFFLVFAITPTASAIAGLVGDIKSKELMVKTLKAKINNIIVAQDTFAQVQEKYPLINVGLPDRPDYYGAANQMAGAMAEIGMKPTIFNFNINSHSSSKIDLPQKVSSYTISVPIESGFSQSQQLITSLINNRRTSSIPSVSFSVQETEQGNKLSLILNATYYYWENTAK